MVKKITRIITSMALTGLVTGIAINILSEDPEESDAIISIDNSDPYCNNFDDNCEYPNLLTEPLFISEPSWSWSEPLLNNLTPPTFRLHYDRHNEDCQRLFEGSLYCFDFIYSHNPEICDWRDNDDDGLVDEGLEDCLMI